jgi:hypothetical protein
VKFYQKKAAASTNLLCPVFSFLVNFHNPSRRKRKVQKVQRVLFGKNRPKSPHNEENKSWSCQIIGGILIFSTSPSDVWPNLAESSSAWSPTDLLHKFEKKNSAYVIPDNKLVIHSSLNITLPLWKGWWDLQTKTISFGVQL